MTEHDDYTDDDAPVAPRPRTMRNSAPEPEVEEAPAQRRNPVEDDAASEAAPIHAGWTAGQKVMDSSSDYAQVLKLDAQIQIIKFLEDQPYANYRRHWVDRMTQKGPSKRAYVCLETVGKSCPLCAIGDRPQAVSAFNVALLGDDGQLLLKTWDVGARLFNVLRAFAMDPKVGPLSRGFFAVNKTGARQNVQYNVIPVKEGSLSEDYDIVPPGPAEISRCGVYDASILQIPKRSELEEIAQELSDYDG